MRTDEARCLLAFEQRINHHCQIVVQNCSDCLRLWIAKARVELDDFWPLIRQHKAGIEHAVKLRALLLERR